MIATALRSITMLGMSKAIQFVILGILLNFCFLACGPIKGYTGPTRKDSEVVRIRPNPIWTNINVTVESVDGMPVNSQVELAVLPGSRTLGLSLAPYTMKSIDDNPGAYALHANWVNLHEKVQATITYDFSLGTSYAFSGTSQTGLFNLWVQENEYKSEKLKTWHLSATTAE